MNYYTTKDFSTIPNDIWSKLSETGEVIITDNNKPTALILDIVDENPEEILSAVRRARAMKAISRLQIHSVCNGLDKMTDEEIDAEIKAVRETRNCPAAAGRCGHRPLHRDTN